VLGREVVTGDRASAFIEAVLDDPGCARVTDLVVATQDRVLAEYSSTGWAARDLFSVTKTVLAILTGIAVDAGYVALDDRGLGEQTIRQLLTMTRGAACGGEFDLDLVAVRAHNWAADFARAPHVHAPGTVFGYDNGAAQLLAEALHRAVPGGLHDFADRSLFRPLGFGEVPWDADPSGTPCGPAHLHLTAGELHRLGGLLLAGGRLEAEQLVSSGWVASMRRRSSPGGAPEGRPYGMGLWLEPDGSFFGAGWAGQLLYCRPRDGLTLVALSDPAFDYGPPATDRMPPNWVAPLTHARRLLLA